MKKTLALIVAVVALLVLALPMVSAQAATPNATATLTFTEDEINNSFRVTNPIDRHFTDVHVDLQAANGGQVEITAVYTWRSRTGVQSANVSVVVVPEIENGRVVWNVVSVTANGQPASASLVSQINTWLAASWRRWINAHAPAGRVTAVSITDTDITFTYTPRF